LDSPPVFAATRDDAGNWSIRPAGSFTAPRRYADRGDGVADEIRDAGSCDAATDQINTTPAARRPNGPTRRHPQRNSDRDRAGVAQPARTADRRAEPVSSHAAEPRKD
jgi:hypothetical protein